MGDEKKPKWKAVSSVMERALAFAKSEQAAGATKHAAAVSAANSAVLSFMEAAAKDVEAAL